MTKKTIYRDTKTGRFCTKASWKRSKKRGGDRYKRERIPVGKRKKKREVTPPPPPPQAPEVFEWVISFSYDKSGRSFDVIVTATEEAEAFGVAREFLRTDSRGRNIVRAKFAGWDHKTVRADRSDEEVGEAEYRDESEEE